MLSSSGRAELLQSSGDEFDPRSIHEIVLDSVGTCGKIVSMKRTNEVEIGITDNTVRWRG